MRGKDFNTGLRGVLFEAQHYERMGAAVWLYGWLVLRQTHQSGSVGWVLGGAPISYREIEEETGFNRRTLERWMTTLRRHGYVETDAVPAGVAVRITKAKKFPQGGRNSAEGVRKVAEGSTQNLQKSTSKYESNQNTTDGIGSSSIVGSQDRTVTPSPNADFHSQTKNQVQNPKKNRNPKSSGLGQTQNQNQPQQRPNQPPSAQREPELSLHETYLLITRLRQQLLRSERDEAVRRELAVGTGPEVPRS
ncbi:MAG TPA: hypothetical protein VI216_06925 [Candidatus Acidoferrales bacterium]